MNFIIILSVTLKLFSISFVPQILATLLCSVAYIYVQSKASLALSLASIAITTTRCCLMFASVAIISMISHKTNSSAPADVEESETTIHTTYYRHSTPWPTVTAIAETGECD